MPLKAFAKTFKLDASFLEDAIAGGDHAVTLQQAAKYLGLCPGNDGDLMLGENGRSYKLLRPVARLGKGIRFSAKRLGMPVAPS